MNVFQKFGAFFSRLFRKKNPHVGLGKDSSHASTPPPKNLHPLDPDNPTAT